MKSDDLVLTYQTTSVGKLDDVYWLQSFLAAFGVLDHSLDEIALIKKQRGRMKKEEKAKEMGKLAEKLNLIYPTRNYVTNSYEGPMAA